MSNIQQPNPRWPPFYRKIEKKVTNYELIYLEWWFWCPNVGLLAQGLTSRQQKNLYVKYLVDKSKMAAILQENYKNSHEACTNSPGMVVLVSKCRFINSRIKIKTTKNLYVKYRIAKSKIAAIFQENSKSSHEM